MVARTSDVSSATSSAAAAAGTALTLATVTTRAILGAGPLLTLTGGLDLQAVQDSVARSAAALVALTFARHTVTARSDRGLQVAGSARIAATGTSRVSSATAPLAGGPLLVAAEAVAAGRALSDSLAAAFGMRTSGSATLPSGPASPIRSVALSLALVDVGAELPDGVPARVLGALSLPAVSSSSSTAQAGAAGGANAATGPSAALNVANALVHAAVSRDVNTGGDLIVQASRGPPGDERYSATVSTPGSFALNLVTRSTRTTAHGTTTTTVVPQKPAFSPPAGAVLVPAATGGTVRFGAATLTFAPGALAHDTWVLVTASRRQVAGLLTLSDVYDLQAWDAVTGDAVHTFAVAPTLSVQVGGLGAAGSIWYVDPVDGPTRIASSSADGVVSAALPHFSPYVVGTSSGTDLLASLATLLASLSSGTPPTAVSFPFTGTYTIGGVLTLTDPTVTVGDLSFTGTPTTYTGTLTVSAASISLGSVLTAADFTLGYVLDGDQAAAGDFTLTTGPVTMTFGSLVTVTAGGLVVSSVTTGTVRETRIGATDVTAVVGASGGPQARLAGDVAVVVRRDGTGDPSMALLVTGSASLTGVAGATLTGTGWRLAYNELTGLATTPVLVSTGPGTALTLDLADGVNTFAGTAAVTVTGLGTLTGSFAVQSSSGTITVHASGVGGTLALGPTTLLLSDGAGDLTLTGSSASLTALQATVALTAGSLGTLTGHMTLSGTSTSLTVAVEDLSATLAAGSATLALTGASGTLTVDGSKVAGTATGHVALTGVDGLDVGGDLTLTLDSGASTYTLAGTGSLTVGGVLSWSGSISASASGTGASRVLTLALTGSSLSLTATLNADGSYRIVDGTVALGLPADVPGVSLSGTATVNVDSALGTFTVTATTATLTTPLGTLSGSLTVSKDGDVLRLTGSGLSMVVGARRRRP